VGHRDHGGDSLFRRVSNHAPAVRSSLWRFDGACGEEPLEPDDEWQLRLTLVSASRLREANQNWSGNRQQQNIGGRQRPQPRLNGYPETSDHNGEFAACDQS